MPGTWLFRVPWRKVLKTLLLYEIFLVSLFIWQEELKYWMPPAQYFFSVNRQVTTRHSSHTHGQTTIKNSPGYFKAKPYEHVLSNVHNDCKNQFNRLVVAWPFSEKTTGDNNFFVNGQPITRRSSHSSGQATHTVKPQKKKKKIPEDISRSSRMTTCFWIPTMTQWLQKRIRI